MSAHIEGVDCPERETRAQLTDDEFWARVAGSIGAGHDWAEPDPDPDQITYQHDPCPECGEHGACAYDSEGRALIHTTTNGDNE